MRTVLAILLAFWIMFILDVVLILRHDYSWWLIALPFIFIFTALWLHSIIVEENTDEKEKD